MRSVLFYDGVCPTPYTQETLTTKSLGGTEASCLRITRALAERGLLVTLEQRNRVAREGSTINDPVDYLPLGALEASPHVVITLRDAGHYVSNKVRFPNAKHYLWMHDVVSGPYRDHMLHHLHNESAHMISVSDWHKTQIIDALMPEVSKGNIRVSRVYGPLADYCVKDSTPYNKNKLVFFSSPHKGLDHVLEIFKKLRRVDKYMTLYVSNPGYFADKDNLPEGVISLGSLPHHSMVIDHVRTALCTFYPNTTFSETFGLVLAESNAVGTPVIAHPIGAAREVLFHPAETMDCNNHEAVIKKVLDWKSGARPIVKGKKEFSLQEVTNQWMKILA